MQDQQSPSIPDGLMQQLHQAVPQLHAWYEAEARDLPWRLSRDPYTIWVSEVMLQQTRVTAVLPYYERWMEAFPDVATLAAADPERVLKLWEGLGYYGRARSLHRAARRVVEDHGGCIPATPDAFRALPGVGPYTAAAVLSLAFDHDMAVLDGNVRRVLSRLLALQQDPRRAPWSGTLESLAGELLPPGTARLHNQAIMELGALVCLPRRPRCGDCPLAAACRAQASGDPAAFPPRTRRKQVPHHQVAIALVFDRQGRVFIDRRPYDGLLGGLWEFPGGKLESGETVEQALARELQEELGMRVERTGMLPPVEHAYSHFSVTLHPRICRLISMDSRAAEQTPCRWVHPVELSQVAMPRANRKVLEHLRASGDGVKKLKKVGQGTE